MAQNYGLMSDMASGIKEGLIAYQTTQNMKRQNQMLGLLHGIQTDDQGNVSYTPQKQAEMAAQSQGLIAQNQQKQRLAQPFSPEERDAYKARGIIVPEGMNRGEYKANFEPIDIANIKGDVSRDARADRNLRQQELDYTKKTAAEEKSTKETNERFTKFGEHIDANRSRSGNFGKMAAVNQASERINTLFQQFPDYNIPGPQTTELATAVAAMISGGSPQSQHQINMMVPASAQGSIADIESYIKGIPVGREQQEFMKQLHDTANREGDLAKDQMNRVITGNIDEFSDLNKKDRARFMRMLKSKGVDVNNLTKGGYYNPEESQHERDLESPTTGPGLLNPMQAPVAASPNVKNIGLLNKNDSSVTHPQDQAAIAWAKANPRDPRAVQILKANGM